jgi:glucose/arabinose dehydrogenase
MANGAGPKWSRTETKAMTASADGRFLYVGIGSNSNITERGMDAEVDRAMVWQIDANRRTQTVPRCKQRYSVRERIALARVVSTAHLRF